VKKLVATLGYAGYSPIAPGTAGSAVAMVAYLAGLAAGVKWGVLGWSVSIAVVYAVGVYTAGAMEREWGHDPGPVVIDEALGYMVTVAGLPVSLTTALVAFFLFRGLDIVKPPPARHSERLPGGWGIMTDDLVAGVYGNLLLRAGQWGAAHWVAR
jgi:phosphatidylglycerophosphatase A